MMSGGEGPEIPESARRRHDAEVRVLVVDDHAFFRGVMCELVAATPGFSVVAQAACGEEALSAAAAGAPDFVLMDIRMPNLGGLEAAERLLERRPELVMLLVTAREPPVSLPPGLAGHAVSVTRKRDLRGALLRETWNARPGAG